MKKINVLGNFSGRNAGDAAILGCLLHDISARYENLQFLIPTINTRFVHQTYSQYNIKPISMMPWHLSVKILGFPALRATLNSDLVLVTDAILFDRKLYNPLFNYLWTLSFILPKAQAKGIPVVPYNCSLGPVRSVAGKACLKRVVDSASLVILRDQESMELLQRENISHPRIAEGADCALNAEPADENRFLEICKKEDLFSNRRPVIGFNVNSYVDAFVRQDGKTFGRENLVDLYAETVDRTIETHDVDVIFIETQHMDMGIANEVLPKIRHRDRVRILSNRAYSYRDLCAVLMRLDLFVGMRTHSLILSSAMSIPPVGIVTYPKNRGYMRTIGMEKNLVEFHDLSAERLMEKIDVAFKQREEIKATMIPRVEREKEKARGSADLLKEYL
jgi:polysaccharide pyruvyl transferase WcaK-like protein